MSWSGDGFGRAIRSRWVPGAVALAVVLLAAALYLTAAHRRAGTILAAPLDDTFIYLQYAQQLARGMVLQYNDGDSPTTGATSFLYLWLLVPGWLVGLRGLQLLVWAWVLNLLLHAWGGLALRELVQRLTGRPDLGLTAMLAYLLSGPLLWGAMSGMDVALTCCLILLTLRGAARHVDAPRSRRARRELLLCGSLLALARPEGMMLAGALTLWLLHRHVHAPRRRGHTLARRLWSGSALLIPVATGVALLALYLVVTGRVTTNASIKAHVIHAGHAPLTYLTHSLDALLSALSELAAMWQPILALVALPLGLAGLVAWIARGSPRQPGTGALAAGWLLLGVLFFGFIVRNHGHHNRYLMPLFPLLIVGAWVALGWLARRPGWRARVALAAAALLPAAGLVHTVAFAGHYGDNCADIVQQHFAAARWLRRNTAPDARVVVNDAGAIPYLSGRHTHDLVGLTDNAFFGAWTHMPYYMNAPVWEALERLEPRPGYLLAYPDWIPDLHGLALFQPLTRFAAPTRTIAGGRHKYVWRLRWERLRDADAPPHWLARGRTLQDRLDVADLRDEADHGYARLDRGWPRGLVDQTRERGRALVDGGRHVRVGEAFTLRARPRQRALLVLRTQGPGEVDLELEVSGSRLRWRAPLRHGLTVASRPIPARLVLGRRLRVVVRALRPYASFHYWLLQRGPGEQPASR